MTDFRSPPSVKMGRQVLGTYDDPNEGYTDLNRARGASGNPNDLLDLIQVRHADPPIRTKRRWALVRYGVRKAGR